VRELGVARIAAERAIAHAVRAGDPAALAAALVARGYIPADRTEGLDHELALTMIRAAISWYAVPGSRRLAPERRRREEDAEREGAFASRPGASPPPETMLIRRMRPRDGRTHPAARERGLGRDRRRVPPQRASRDGAVRP
jgi:hypothetical protein